MGGWKTHLFSSCLARLQRFERFVFLILKTVVQSRVPHEIKSPPKTTSASICLDPFHPWQHCLTIWNPAVTRHHTVVQIWKVKKHLSQQGRKCLRIHCWHHLVDSSLMISCPLEPHTWAHRTTNYWLLEMCRTKKNRESVCVYVCVCVCELRSSTHKQTTWLHQCQTMRAFRLSVCTGIMCENPFIYTF